MPPRLLSSCAVFCLLGALAPQPAEAQQPSHQHYAEPAAPPAPSPTGALAPRLQNLGPHIFPVSTRSEQAQLFVNQGLNLSYGFNHAEAGRAFREAARLDPQCAMAYWGQALVLGPNINAPMDPAQEPVARDLALKAQSRSAAATPREQALITALVERYSGRAEDRAARDAAYAAAMRSAWQRFPDDPDVAMLYVESAMDLRPWGYWMPDGTPHEGTREIVALTEEMIRRHPKHPGALHLYIHLMESTSNARAAEAAADALLTLAPAAGHLVHMPAHIYQRVGRYADAVRANELAIAADEDYITQCRAQGMYPMAYYPHNVHFLWFAATMDGRGQTAIEAARKVAAGVPDEAMRDMPLLAGFKVTPYYALTRFARWDEMLAEPRPPADNAFLTGVWHYARGLAQLGKGRVAEATGELATLRAVIAEGTLDFPMFSPNLARDILAIGPEVLAGELAAAQQDYDRAIAHLERAVRLEDGLVYTEPEEWHFPPRHALGAVLLAAGRPREAETVYWEDLTRHPANGWALRGLVEALRAQKKERDAALVQARLEAAWPRADPGLTAP